MDDFSYELGKRLSFEKRAMLGAGKKLLMGGLRDAGSWLARRPAATAEWASQLPARIPAYLKTWKPQMADAAFGDASRAMAEQAARPGVMGGVKTFGEGMLHGAVPRYASEAGGNMFRYGRAAGRWMREHPWTTIGTLGGGAYWPTLPLTEERRKQFGAMLTGNYNGMRLTPMQRAGMGFLSSTWHTPGLNLISPGAETMLYGASMMPHPGLLGKAMGAHMMYGGAKELMHPPGSETAQDTEMQQSEMDQLQQYLGLMRARDMFAGGGGPPDYYSKSFGSPGRSYFR